MGGTILNTDPIPAVSWDALARKLDQKESSHDWNWYSNMEYQCCNNSPLHHNAHSGLLMLLSNCYLTYKAGAGIRWCKNYEKCLTMEAHSMKVLMPSVGERIGKIELSLAEDTHWRSELSLRVSLLPWINCNWLMSHGVCHSCRRLWCKVIGTICSFLTCSIISKVFVVNIIKLGVFDFLERVPLLFLPHCWGIINGFVEKCVIKPTLSLSTWNFETCCIYNGLK